MSNIQYLSQLLTTQTREGHQEQTWMRGIVQATMEARAIELKRKKDGSQNSRSGLAAAGGEGWLYFWDVVDTRFH